MYEEASRHLRYDSSSDEFMSEDELEIFLKRIKNDNDTPKDDEKEDKT